MTGPVSAPDPTADLRTRIAVALSKAATGKGTRLGRLRFPLADAAVEAMREHVTDVHTRNATLRAEHSQMASDRADAVRGYEQERAAVQSMVRDLHAALFDGSTSLPDRPLDTVWEWLLTLVRQERARLVSGSAPTIPDDAEEQIAYRIADYWTLINGDAEPDDSDYGIAHHVLDLVLGWGSAVANPTDGAADLLPALAEAMHLSADTEAGVLLAEVRDRFKYAIRSVVGHAYRNGYLACECGLSTPTLGAWSRHQDELRAAGEPVAHLPAEETR